MPLPVSPRLAFREMADADLDDMAALVADEDVMRFYPRPLTRSEALGWITRNQRRYRDHGFGLHLEKHSTAPNGTEAAIYATAL
jgi:RimJ/RimL family protein N-acetyltransferase